MNLQLTLAGQPGDTEAEKILVGHTAETIMHAAGATSLLTTDMPDPSLCMLRFIGLINMPEQSA